MADELPVKHDSEKDIFRGQLFLFLGGVVLAFGQDATLSVTAAEVDASNKMTGDWEAPFYGKKSFTVTSNSLLTEKEGLLSHQTLLKSLTDGTVLDFWMGQTIKTEGDNLGGKYAKDLTKPSQEGKVIVTSLEKNSANGDLVKVSSNFKGFGALISNDGTPAGGE